MKRKHSVAIGLLLILVLGLMPTVDNLGAAGASDAYFDAENCYAQLKKNAAGMRLRHNWQRCIGKFERAYRVDTRGPWAPASLYMSAVLYRELSKQSGSRSDRNEANTRFQQIIDRFPNSRYRAKAAAAIAPAGTVPTATHKPTKRSPATIGTAIPKEKYMQADACYRKLSQSRARQKFRHNWQKCIGQFEDVYRADPTGAWAPAGLFMQGRLYQELYRWSKNADDAAAAREAYDRIIADFHQSRYRPKAQREIETHAELRRAVTQKSRRDDVASLIDSKSQTENSSTAEPVKTEPRPLDAATATVKNLRFWSNPSYTRVVIDADRETGFSHRLLKKDPSLHKPERLYVDLKNSRLGKNIQRTYPINDDLLIDARAGQFSSESVRVVVDIKSFETYKIFSLRDPFRIVIDIRGQGGQTPPVKPETRAGKIEKNKLPAGALAKQLALGVSRIVIDPGHGGRDFGAPGYLKGVHEKQVVLQIAKRLAKLLKAELECEVILTRTGDRYLTLEERTAFANTKNADLFISLHTNAHRDRRATGIETYFLNLATDDEAIRVAAMENATSQKNISDLQTILNDLMQNAKINESSRLAAYVQSNIVAHLKRTGYRRIKNKGVKKAPFYVLLGAQMPAILIETSFISNPDECKRLVNPKFQNRIAEAVLLGVKKYIQTTQSTALNQPPPLLIKPGNALVAPDRSDS